MSKRLPWFLPMHKFLQRNKTDPPYSPCLRRRKNIYIYIIIQCLYIDKKKLNA